MAGTPRRVRALLYDLTDVENTLRCAGRTPGADSVRVVVRRGEVLPPAEFLDESRRTLEEILLGERDLPAEIVRTILDVIATIDDVFREIGTADRIQEIP
jgi:hypothetical protein